MIQSVAQRGPLVIILTALLNACIIICVSTVVLGGESGGVVGLGTALTPISFPMVSLEFFFDLLLPAPLWPWDSVSDIKE